MYSIPVSLILRHGFTSNLSAAQGGLEFTRTFSQRLSLPQSSTVKGVCNPSLLPALSYIDFLEHCICFTALLNSLPWLPLAFRMQPFKALPLQTWPLHFPHGNRKCVSFRCFSTSGADLSTCSGSDATPTVPSYSAGSLLQGCRLAKISLRAFPSWASIPLLVFSTCAILLLVFAC